ncbi:MAG: hypothetical protein EZS28_008410, partial [Streblomastix strix]
ISLADELWNQFRELRERSSKEDSEIEARRLAQENRFRNGIFAVPSVFERVGGSASPRELLNRGTFSPGLTKSLEHARNSASAIFVESSAIAQRKREAELILQAEREMKAQAIVRRRARAQACTGPASSSVSPQSLEVRGLLPSQIMALNMTAATNVGGLKSGFVNPMKNRKSEFIQKEKQHSSDGYWTADFETVHVEELDDAAEHLDIQNDIDFINGAHLNQAMMKHMLVVDKRHQKSSGYERELAMHRARLKQIEQNGTIDASSVAAVEAKQRPPSFVAAKAEARLASMKVSVDELSHILNAHRKEKLAMKAGENPSLFDPQSNMQQDTLKEDTINLMNNINDSLWRLSFVSNQSNEKIKEQQQMININGSYLAYSKVFKQENENEHKKDQYDSLRIVPKQWIRKHSKPQSGSSLPPRPHTPAIKT